MEVLVNLNQNFSSEHRVVAIHLTSHFIVLVVSVCESQSGLGMQHWIDLVSVQRNEFIIQHQRLVLLKRF